MVVFGNPLFLNEGADAVFSMKDGAVPTDGHLFLDRKFSIYSIAGRERALAGQLFYWGHSGDGVFLDDSHKQRVARFWSVYLKSQSATLVSFLPSLAGAAESAQRRDRTPMMADDPDPHAKATMLTITKGIRTENEAGGAAKRKEESGKAKNARGAALDVHGNPVGDANDLIRAGQMSGKRILFVTFDHYPEIEASPLPGALREKGFEVERVRYPLPQLAAWKAMLASADQVWVISSEATDHFPKTHRAALVERWKAGMDLYLAGDNAPYFCEANAVLAMIASGVKLSGNCPGMQKLGPAENGDAGFVPGSLFHGINTFFEGNTVSSVAPGGGFKSVCRHSGGGVLLATLDDGKAGRVVIDGGYTKWFPQYFEQAGAGRLAVNIAGWLAGVDAE